MIFDISEEDVTDQLTLLLFFELLEAGTTSQLYDQFGVKKKKRCECEVERLKIEYNLNRFSHRFSST